MTTPPSPYPISPKGKPPPEPDLHPIELFLPEIRELLHNRRFEELRDLLTEINPIDLADGLSHFAPEERVLILKLLSPHRMVQVFEELELPDQRYVVEHMDDTALSPLLQDIPADVTAQLFKKLPEKFVKKMATLMKRERLQQIQSLAQYPPRTAGTLMNTDVFVISPEFTAKAAIETLQACLRARRETDVTVIYVTNENNRLLGAVHLRTLISAPADIKVKEIMSPVAFYRVLATADQEVAAKLFSRYKLLSAPVVDDANRLVGVLTVDDVMDIIQEETTEDIQKQAGMEALEEPYFKIAFTRMVKKRATWLCVLFFGEMLTATAMAFFEHELAQALVLALFIPLIISSGGNSGSQAATLVVRGMALKEITMADWWRVVRRELGAGLALGLLLGGIGFLRVVLWSQFSHVYGPHYALVGATLAVSLVLVVLWGTLSGSVIPLVLRRLRLDPAVVSAPLVATLVDVVGLVIYFTAALFILRGTLL